MAFSNISLLICLVALSTQVWGHARVTTPTPRKYSTVAQSACGAAVYGVLTSDLAGPIENAVKKIDSSYSSTACPLYFCRGASIEDNASNTRAYAAGTVVNFKVDLVAHHTGYANVSVVDLASHSLIGSPIYNWPVYANESLGPSAWPKNETDFNITVPNLGTKCSKAGACAIQWWWYAYSNGQTYESCIDFTQ